HGPASTRRCARAARRHPGRAPPKARGGRGRSTRAWRLPGGDEPAIRGEAESALDEAVPEQDEVVVVVGVGRRFRDRGGERVGGAPVALGAGERQQGG